MAFASVVAEEWLYGLLLPIPAVTAAFAGRVYVNEAGARSAADGPYLAFTRVVALESGAIGVGTTSWQFAYDVVGWLRGTVLQPIEAAMNAIDAALVPGAASVREGFLITVDGVGAEVPPAPPAQSGQPPASRLGKTYTLFVSRA